MLLQGTAGTVILEISLLLVGMKYSSVVKVGKQWFQFLQCNSEMLLHFTATKYNQSWN